MLLEKRQWESMLIFISTSSLELGFLPVDSLSLWILKSVLIGVSIDCVRLIRGSNSLKLQRSMVQVAVGVALVTAFSTLMPWDQLLFQFEQFNERTIELYNQAFGWIPLCTGRLVPSLGDGQQLEIDCNGAGVVVAAAETKTKLSQLGDLVAPKPDFKQFVGFLHEENEEVVEIKDMPLLFIQLTQLGCGGVAFASRYNQANMAALTLGKDMVLISNPDRTVFRAWKHPHYE
ncbi:omega-hydroxypalmitate O-feruloyl transferase-like [Rhododendron vialii]|uniref:omega-hydroxypalmitate O-feruloyl transferase-like n=1 Tax=Rhododendron vialii TaxID=182163 RepID=UPI00265DD7DC|nr:omega-hydroxypalmitate O-feruloyl transferase-like [Rhododendron vialii]